MKENILIASAGQFGDKVRSDCFIQIEIKNRGGIKLNLRSKVEVMYGDSIKKLIHELCNYFDIKSAEIKVDDFGALPLTIAARFECAYNRIFPDNKKEFLLPKLIDKKRTSTKDRLRRSRLYLPGNEPKFFPNAALHSPDGIILDLEDSVSPAEKDAARLLVRNTLRGIDFLKAERMVRINQLPNGLKDLSFIVPHDVDVILVPKAESAEHIINVDREIERLREIHNIKNHIFIMPIIESALGVERAFEIASASSKVCSLAVGLEDYTADLGVERTLSGTESFYARTAIINAAKAVHIQAIDTVFSDVSDMDALHKSVIEAKALGFEGKGCIHPRQIKVVHEAFAPNTAEIDKAKKIVIAFIEAQEKGLGVVSLGTKMIDAPVVKRAQKTIDLAILTGVLEKNWHLNT